MSSSAMISNEEMVDLIGQKSVMEIVEMTKIMEERFGVSAAAMPLAVNNAASAEPAPVVEEKTEFSVFLSGFDASKKVSLIKAVRGEVKEASLIEAKKMVEDSQNTSIKIKENIPKADAEALKKALEEAGGKVELK